LEGVQSTTVLGSVYEHIFDERFFSLPSEKINSNGVSCFSKKNIYPDVVDDDGPKSLFLQRRSSKRDSQLTVYECAPFGNSQFERMSHEEKLLARSEVISHINPETVKSVVACSAFNFQRLRNAIGYYIFRLYIFLHHVVL
jgi:hypothetical protein